LENEGKKSNGILNDGKMDSSGCFQFGHKPHSALPHPTECFKIPKTEIETSEFVK
jgi:hypothetical protein